MVKRAITMLIVGIILIGLAITEMIIVENFIENVETQINELVVKFDDNRDDISVLTPLVEEIEQTWDSKEYILCLMFNHKDMSMVTDSITRVKEYCKQNNYGDGIVEVMILQEYAKKNHNIMGFNFNNIL